MPIGLIIKRIHMRFERACNQTLAQYALTRAQMQILRYVYECEQKGRHVNQRSIETALCVKNPTVTGLLKRLEQKGYIEREPDPTDARAKLIHLTDRESALRLAMTREMACLEAHLTEGFSQAERAELIRLLTKVQDNIERETEGQPSSWERN